MNGSSNSNPGPLQTTPPDRLLRREPPTPPAGHRGRHRLRPPTLRQIVQAWRTRPCPTRVDWALVVIFPAIVLSLVILGIAIFANQASASGAGL